MTVLEKIEARITALMALAKSDIARLVAEFEHKDAVDDEPTTEVAAPVDHDAAAAASFAATQAEVNGPAA